MSADRRQATGGRSHRAALLVVAMFSWAPRAHSQPSPTPEAPLAARSFAPEQGERPAAPPSGTPGEGARNWGNLRVGSSTGNLNGKPEVCAELSPARVLTIEACGTGAGIWHHDAAAELAHFRANVTILTLPLGSTWLEPRLGAGFAELAIGPDDPGFRFGSTGARKVETAGPEAAGSVRLLCPITQAFELVGNVSFGAAWLQHAPDLASPQARFQPFFGASLGAGF